MAASIAREPQHAGIGPGYLDDRFEWDEAAVEIAHLRSQAVRGAGDGNDFSVQLDRGPLRMIMV